MIRTLLLLSAIAFALVFLPAAALAQAATAATPENAASFIGDWTLSLEGGMGASQAALSIKVDAGKLVGSISNAGQQGQPIQAFSLSGKALVMSYAFDYNGSSIDTTVTLTPSGDKTAAEMSFAGGAYVMSGSAEKKK